MRPPPDMRRPGLGVEDLSGAPCLLRFDAGKHSVMASVPGRPVEIHACAGGIMMRRDGAIVGEHRRALGRGKTIHDPWHHVPVLARKPDALRNDAPHACP